MQLQDRVNSAVVKPASSNPNPATSPKATRLIGWATLGVIAACGICCSLPLLATVTALVSATALLSLVWPLVGLVVALTIAIIVIGWRTKKSRGRGGVIALRQSCAPTLTTAARAESSATSACQVGGSCGCQER